MLHKIQYSEKYEVIETNRKGVLKKVVAGSYILAMTNRNEYRIVQGNLLIIFKFKTWKVNL